MAYTLTKAEGTVHGNRAVWQGTLAVDAASGAVSFGFSTIVHAHVTPKSATTGGVRFRINALASGTAAAGSLGVSGATSGDEFFVTVYGR